MISNFVKDSLKLNLFFLRIMKEHALFLAAAFQPHQKELIQEAIQFNNVYNNLLLKAIDLSKGVVDLSDDIVTQYTLNAEKATSFLTGVPVDTSLTQNELQLVKQEINRINDQTLEENIRALNERAIKATRSLIRFKTKILDGVLACKLYTANYPLLIDHIRREAILFVDSLNNLQNGVEQNLQDIVNEEIFWNRIMAEHSEFIRGFLDPTEEQLIGLANQFSIQFKELNNKAVKALKNTSLIQEITNDSLKLTKDIKGFKTQGLEALLNCKIKSIIFPLLADHVVRESNHFIHLLEKIK